VGKGKSTQPFSTSLSRTARRAPASKVRVLTDAHKRQAALNAELAKVKADEKAGLALQDTWRKLNRQIAALRESIAVAHSQLENARRDIAITREHFETSIGDQSHQFHVGNKALGLDAGERAALEIENWIVTREAQPTAAIAEQRAFAQENGITQPN
jgi:hypothetical protein